MVRARKKKNSKREFNSSPIPAAKIYIYIHHQFPHQTDTAELLEKQTLETIIPKSKNNINPKEPKTSPPN